MNPVVKALSTLTARLKAAGAMLFSGAGGGAWDNWESWLPRTRFDYAREVDANNSNIVMACVLWIARAFPEAPLRILDREGASVTRHPLLDLLNAPNPFYDGALLWMATLIDYTISGNAYWLKVRAGGGRPVQLWYVPQWLIEPKWPQDGSEFISHYEYRPNSRPIRYDIADVVHFRFGLDPTNPRKGLSPLASVLREIFTDDEAANFSGSLLRNLGVPGVVIAPKDKDAAPNPTQAEETRDKFDQRFGGDGRGRTMVMTVPTDIRVLSFSPEQMNLRELRKIPEERVTAVLGIPAIVAGMGSGLDRSTFANFAEAREMAMESNIIPTQRLLAATIWRQLLPDFGDALNLKIDFDLSQVRVLQDDEDKKYERLSRGVTGGWLMVSEARRATGWEVTPEHDVFLIPSKSLVVPADHLLLTAPPVLEAEEEEEDRRNGHAETDVEALVGME